VTIENQLLEKKQKFRLARPLKKSIDLTSYQKFTGQDVPILKERRRKREGAPFLRKIANQLQTEIDKAKPKKISVIF